MSVSASVPAVSSRLSGERRFLLVAAWAVLLLLTVPQIILGAFMQQDVEWLAPARIVALATLVVFTLVWKRIRPLRGFAVILLVIYAAEGWFFLTLLPQTQFYAGIFGVNANLAFFGERMMRIGASAVMLLVLLMMGMKRHDFFLAIGNLNATAEPECWGIPRKPETWLGFGGRFALIVAAILLLLMIPTMQPSLSNLSVGLVLFAALCAAMNAFAEEFLYRSALLPQVLPLFGKGAAMILVATWFGMGHYFAVPSGITGVIFVTFGGWVFAKSMIETRGMGWSLIMHFASDFTVYMVIFLAGGF